MDQRVDSERRSDSGLGSPNRDAAASDTAAKGGVLRRRRGLVTALVIGGVILAVLLVLWWLNARQYESTDDAFIDARTVQISAQVAAAIVDVPVTDNQMVEAGAELVRLDDRDFTWQRDQTKASVDNLVAQIAAQQAKIEQAKKQVAQAEAALTFAQQESDR